jgi:hypothetical protein
MPATSRTFGTVSLAERHQVPVSFRHGAGLLVESSPTTFKMPECAKRLVVSVSSSFGDANHLLIIIEYDRKSVYKIDPRRGGEYPRM